MFNYSEAFLNGNISSISDGWNLLQLKHSLNFWEIEIKSIHLNVLNAN